ncbi:hypothetical protein GCM10007853_03690 [Algimonas ampicilliniresistens]|uniref:histidine kinase n=1 Tax=Algimonas ampicilliniresistens TaxID=1298735 RepID=A0ABQ5V5Y6_9PROT|nr:PAS domain-containing sensor histidine kinase [Algimonas ampicilliniresistens]GLQ22495.1 hypothetical protein GCM10007853_03690 [Algimonas ampicilliniresistens]
MPLYDSVAILESILATIVDAVVVIDQIGRIRLFNPASQTMFGYSEDEILGKNVNILMPEPYRSEHDSHIARHQRTGENHIIGIGRELKGRRKSGEIFPLQLSVGENRFPDSLGYVGIIRDLTKSREYTQRLETLEMNHAHLARIMAANQLGTAIAHELNQPLAALVNYMEAGLTFMETNHAKSGDPLTDIMSKASDEAHKASRILARLRQFVERGDVTRSEVDVEQACDAALSLVMPSFRNLHITVARHCPPELPTVLASGVQVEQVLVNLIRNAFEAMAEMEDDAPKRITLSGECLEDMVRVCVSDTGPGMDDEKLLRIFEPLYSTKSNGLGIGLSLCRDLICSHGGTLDAERNASGGMSFAFTLPRYAP